MAAKVSRVKVAIERFEVLSLLEVLASLRFAQLFKQENAKAHLYAETRVSIRVL
jgi:hypothetical protein